MCGKMFSPFCQYVGTRLSTDVEKLVLSIHEADPDFAADMVRVRRRLQFLVWLTHYLKEDEDEDIYVIPFPSPSESSTLPCLPSDESVGLCTEGTSSLLCLSGAKDVPEFVRAPQGVLIPRIIITPAPPQQCREMSSCVPVQDTSFGARLTVPSHSALNTSHPPMAAPFYPHAPLHVTVRNWTYRFGHWCAVAPALDEQERRGIFSRPISARRRKMRKRAGGVRDVSVSCQNVFARTKRDS